MGDENGEAAKEPKLNRRNFLRSNLQGAAAAMAGAGAVSAVTSHMYHTGEAKKEFLNALETDDLKTMMQLVEQHSFGAMNVKQYSDMAIRLVVKNEKLTQEEKVLHLGTLLDRGADPNKYKKFPAIYACIDNPELLRMLLEAKAEPDNRSFHPSLMATSYRPVEDATYEKQPESMQMLFEYGADPF